jgi:hypothetical protein
MLKEFNSYFVANKNISNIKNINDFRKNYTFKYKKPIISNNKNIIFLIGLNLRVESPIYNIILRQLSLFNKNKVKIISFGSTSNLTYKF